MQSGAQRTGQQVNSTTEQPPVKSPRRGSAGSPQHPELSGFDPVSPRVWALGSVRTPHSSDGSWALRVHCGVAEGWPGTFSDLLRGRQPQICSSWGRRQVRGWPAWCVGEAARREPEPHRTLSWEQPQRENRQAGLGPWRNVEETDPGFLPSCVIVFRLLRCSEPEFPSVLNGHNHTPLAGLL